jgi:hypothetical protein
MFKNIFNIDLNSDRVKAIIVIIILLILALYNFFSIPQDVLENMKKTLNEKGHKIYAQQNRELLTGNGLNGLNGQSALKDQREQTVERAQRAQVGGANLNTGLPTQGFFYMQEAPNYRMSQWDQLQNTWDPIRLHDRFNVQSNPIVYQGFGIPLMSDLMCSSFAGLGKDVPNKNDRAMIPALDRNVLGTIPSDEPSMFYFSDNISSPECCPGPYSSDAGCVCSFEKASFPLKAPIPS